MSEQKSDYLSQGRHFDIRKIPFLPKISEEEERLISNMKFTHEVLSDIRKVKQEWEEWELRDAKFTRKYMKLAKTLADDNTACYSRKIGVVLVSASNRIISLGYNGSVEGAPHNDEAVYLKHLWDNLLIEEHKSKLGAEQSVFNSEEFAAKFEGCKQCPRKILGLESGKYLEYCSCAHAERNALASANRSGVSTEGSSMFCWCSVPCHECTTQIIQSGVRRVVCLDTGLPDYSSSSRGLFSMTGVKLDLVKTEWIFANG